MLHFKFQQNRTIKEEFDFFEGEKRGGGRGPPFINVNLKYYWYTYKNAPFQISAKSHTEW